MIPLNHCRQMVKFYSSRKAILHDEQWCIDLSSIAQKFVLPAGGVLIDDKELRALDKDMPLSLPFKAIALEFCDEGQWDESEYTVKEKEIILCTQRDDEIIILSIASHEIVPRLSRGEMPDGWSSPTIYSMPRRDYFRVFEGENQIRHKGPDDESHKWASHKGPLWNVLSFLNALACHNVQTEQIQRAKAWKQPKKALPFDDYHVLTVKVPASVRSPSVEAAGHRSPREHLRRGHIRRLQDRKIWVNATVVCANKGLGKIAKDYAVKA